MKIAEIRTKFPQYADLSDRELVKNLHSKFYSDVDYPTFLRRIDFSERVDATKDMNVFEKFMAGSGKAVSDLGLGIRQLVGNASQQEVDEVKARDAALMETGAGFVGNIVGNVATSVLPGLGAVGLGKLMAAPLLTAGGKALLAAPATLGGAATQATLGAAQAALQPVATGESRPGNTLVGAAGGAFVPVVSMGLKGTKAAIEPLYEKGRQQILARALREVTGDNADTVVQRLRGSRELVPGSAPTAAEVANSGGLAALQRTAAAVDPEAYATRAAQQNEARVAALQAIEGAPGARSAASALRESKAGAFYRQAMADGVDPEMAKMLQPQINNLMERIPSSVMDKARDLAKLNGEVLDKSGSVQGLHYVKTAVDDLLSGASQTGIGKQTQRGLMQLKGDLLTVLDDLAPFYGKGRETFAALSRPINQMDVGAELAERSINKLTNQLQPQAYARTLTDDLAARATGFNKATLANTMEPGQIATLNAIKNDLARSVAARDLGRGAGSDTLQKLSMTNLMNRAGIPVGVLDAPGIGRLGNWLYSNTDDKMKAALAKALLNPAATADIMAKGVPNEKTRLLAEVLRRTLTPAAAGTAVSLSDAR